jgi:hypothetical protein
LLCRAEKKPQEQELNDSSGARNNRQFMVLSSSLTVALKAGCVRLNCRAAAEIDPVFMISQMTVICHRLIIFCLLFFI